MRFNRQPSWKAGWRSRAVRENGSTSPPQTTAGRLSALSLASGGFSLVEIMVASIILWAGVIGAFAYFTYGRSTLNIDAHKRVALEIAASRMEEIRACSAGGLSGMVEDGTTVQVEALYGFRTTAIANVDENGDGTTDYYQATVTVSWTENGRTQQVQLITFRSTYREG